MNILLLSRYGRKGASSRIRSYQYLSFLKQMGMDVEVSPLLDDKYLDAIYSGRKPNLVRLSLSYAYRLIKLFQSKKYDLLWIEKELFPWLPAFAEQALSLMKIPYVVDYDDALFHRYDEFRFRIVRYLLAKS